MRPRIPFVASVVGAVVLAASFVAPLSFLVSASARTRIATAAAVPTTDGALARTALADQLTLIRRGFGGSGRMVGTANSATACNSGAPSLAGRTARAISPSLYYARGLEVRVEDYVYPDQSAASRALRSIGGEQDEACRAHLYVDELRKQRRYEPGRLDILPPQTVQAGDTARASEIIVPATYKGRVFRFTLDSVAARQGRVIVLFTTVSTAPVLTYDVKVVRAMAKIASVVQQSRASNTRGAPPSG